MGAHFARAEHLTADALVSGADVTVMTELATTGATSGTLGSLRAATVRYDYRNQMVEYAADDAFAPHMHMYLYDTLGRRVLRRVADGQTGLLVGTRIVSAGNTRRSFAHGSNRCKYTSETGIWPQCVRYLIGPGKISRE